MCVASTHRHGRRNSEVSGTFFLVKELQGDWDESNGLKEKKFREIGTAISQMIYDQCEGFTTFLHQFKW